MNHRELAVLDALNIASTQHARAKADECGRYYRAFQATAAQIALTLNTDDRVQGAYGRVHKPAEVGATLGRLAKGWPTRRAPLVERVGTRRWRLTDAGVAVLTA